VKDCRYRIFGTGVTEGDNELLAQSGLLFLVATTAVEAENGVSVSDQYGECYGESEEEPLNPHHPSNASTCDPLLRCNYHSILLPRSTIHNLPRASPRAFFSELQRNTVRNIGALKLFVTLSR